MHTRRIFWQIYPGHLVITFFTLLVCLAVFTSALERFYRQQVAETLEDLALFSTEQVRDRFDANNLDYLNATAARLGSKSPARITLILPDGTVAGESVKSRELMENHSDRPEVKIAMEQGRAGQAIRFSSSVRKTMLYVAVPVYRDNALVGVVRAATPLLRMHEVLRGTERNLLWGGVVILLLASLFSL